MGTPCGEAGSAQPGGRPIRKEQKYVDTPTREVAPISVQKVL